MKKIAVMLPHPYRGGTLRGAKIIAKSIVLAAQSGNDDVHVVFSYVQTNDYVPNIDFCDLSDMGISLRPTQWEVFNVTEDKQYQDGFLKSQLRHPLTYEKYCLPKDGMNDFFDCDLWIIVSDRLLAPIYPVKKYICIVYDYIQRYVPGIFADRQAWDLNEAGFLPAAREADRLFVTTPSTMNDAVAYAGVDRKRIRLLPMNFEPLESVVSPKILQPYFLWATNTAFHKNALNSFKALDLYYGSFHGQLDVLVTGENVSVFDFEMELPQLFDVEHIRASRQLLVSNPELFRHIRFRRFSDTEYADALSSAKFLWHTALYDNGAYAVLEAAYLGVPSLSARYPAMEFMDRDFGLNLVYFDPTDALSMAKALQLMEQNYSKISLPPKEFLQNYSWRENASSVYQAVMEVL